MGLTLERKITVKSSAAVTEVERELDAIDGGEGESFKISSRTSGMIRGRRSMLTLAAAFSLKSVIMTEMVTIFVLYYENDIRGCVRHHILGLCEGSLFVNYNGPRTRNHISFGFRYRIEAQIKTNSIFLRLEILF